MTFLRCFLVILRGEGSIITLVVESEGEGERKIGNLALIYRDDKSREGGREGETRRDTPALCRLRVLTTISLCLLLLGRIFLSRIPFDVFVTNVLQRSVTRLPLSEVRNRGGKRQVAIILLSIMTKHHVGTLVCERLHC